MKFDINLPVLFRTLERFADATGYEVKEVCLKPGGRVGTMVYDSRSDHLETLRFKTVLQAVEHLKEAM